MSQLSIPKRLVTGELHLVGGETRQVDLYLSETAETHRGPERPSDVLMRKTRFIPVHDHSVGFAAVSTSAILWLSVPLLTEIEGEGLLVEDLAASMSTSIDVEIHVVGGAQITGTVVYLQPHGKQRLQDFLAEAPPFFVVRDGEHAHVVNVAHVTVVFPKSAA